MKETLFLPSSSFPSIFSTRSRHFEQSLLNSLNTHGHARNVTDVRYVDMKSKFPHFQKFTSKFVGAICETTLISRPRNAKSDEYVWEESDGDKLYQHRIRAFVVATDVSIKSRNNYVAQSLFPFLFAELKSTLNCSCKVLSTKPIYLVCLLDGGVKIPRSTERDFKFASAAGIRVLAPMREKPVVAARAIGVEVLNRLQPAKEPSKVLFSINPKTKTFKIEAEGLESLLDSEKKIHGSSEKFGMMILVPAAIVARRCGYSLDIRAFDGWLLKLGAPKSEGKIASLQVVGEYLRKLAK